MPLSTSAQHALNCLLQSGSALELEKLDIGELAGSAADALPQLLSVCRLNSPSTPSVLLASWKCLGRLVSAETKPPLSPPDASSVFDFALDQVKETVMSHDWTDTNHIKISKFCCVQFLALVRGNPSQAYTAIGYKVIELYHAINFRTACGDWRRCCTEVASCVSIRLEAAIGAMGGSRALPHAHRLQLLTKCSSLAGKQATESAVWASRCAPASSCLCCLAAFREIQNAGILLPESAQLLRVLLLWLPGMANAVAVSSTQSLQKHLPTGPAEEELFRIVAESSSDMSGLVFSSSLTLAESKVTASEVSHAQKWRMAALRLFSSHPQLAAESTVMSLLLASLTVANDVSLNLMEELWLSLIDSTHLAQLHAGDLRTLRTRLLSFLLTAGVRCHGDEAEVPRQLAISTARIIRKFWTVPGSVEHKRPLMQLISEHLRDCNARVRRGAHLQAVRCYIHVSDLPPLSSLLSDEAHLGEIEAVGHGAKQLSAEQRTQLLENSSALGSGWRRVALVAALLEEEQPSPLRAWGEVFDAAVLSALSALSADDTAISRRLPIILQLLRSCVAVDANYFSDQPAHSQSLQAFRQLLDTVFRFATGPLGSWIHKVLVIGCLQHIATYSRLAITSLFTRDALKMLNDRLRLVESGHATKQAPSELYSRSTPSSGRSEPVCKALPSSPTTGGAMPLAGGSTASSLHPAALGAALKELESALLPYYQEANDSSDGAGSMAPPALTSLRVGGQEIVDMLSRVHSMLSAVLPRAEGIRSTAASSGATEAAIPQSCGTASSPICL
jgi:hypothetical protein